MKLVHFVVSAEKSLPAVIVDYPTPAGPVGVQVFCDDQNGSVLKLEVPLYVEGEENPYPHVRFPSEGEAEQPTLSERVAALEEAITKPQ